MKLSEEDLLFPIDAPNLDDPHWSAEWLVTNALGGCASGPVPGHSPRRYHGFLIAALPAPWGRTMMLNELYEQVELSDGKVYHLGANQEPARLDSASIALTPRFR